MKYCMIIPEGMADVRYQSLGNRTPLEYAKTEAIEELQSKSEIGTVRTIPEWVEPTSVNADLSVLSYMEDGKRYGMGPFEAIGAGVPMTANDIAYRCSLITLSESDEGFTDRKVIDYSGGEISTEEATSLFKALNEGLGIHNVSFYPGKGFRGIMVIRNADKVYDFPSPQDIAGTPIGGYFIDTKEDEDSPDLIRVMEKSFEILNNHPINAERKQKGLRPANAIWLWSGGGTVNLIPFKQKHGISGAIIGADNLIRGIGIAAGMNAPKVEGATGNLASDFNAKAHAAIEEFRSGTDFVCVHIEATDECGHHGNAKMKAEVIERIDKEIVAPVYSYLKECGENFRMIILSNIATPCNARIHSISPVPYLLYKSDVPADNSKEFSEYAECDEVKEGKDIMNMLIEENAQSDKKEKDQKPGKFAVGLFDWIELFACAMICVIIALTFFFRHSPVWGSSMYPTLMGKSTYTTETTLTKGYDVLVMSNLFYKPTKGDIVVIQEPTQPTEPIVKRIIATEGDSIIINFNTWEVTVNGTVLDEPYVNYIEGVKLTSQNLIPDSNNCWEGLVPAGKIFVLGDNRLNSKDSRSFGFIDERYIIGKVLFRILPFDRFGTVD
ncbi:MAG: signal peptidase I [Clostridia bacterium]|nr:signal peptidase I [Clostridia bacterium]